MNFTKYTGELLNQFKCENCGELDIDFVIKYPDFIATSERPYSTDSKFICNRCEKSKVRDLKIENILEKSK